MQNFMRIIVVIALAIASVASLASVAVAADPGTISGYVYKEDGSTAIGGALVEAYDYNVVDTNPSAVPAGSAYTAGSGAYTITNLPAGTYRVRAVAVGYFTEYYDNVSISSSADPVEVTASVDPTGINFSLAPGGSISGLVFEEDGVTPINEAHVIAYDNSTGVMVKVDETWAPSSSNAYSLGTDLPAGNYLVKAQAVGYFTEYYDNVTDAVDATLVQVTVGNDTPNIDFTLTPGGSISGSVYSDNGTPIYGCHVVAYDNVTLAKVDETWTPGASPNYAMGTDLPAGNYLVKAEALGYFTEYYDNITTTDPDLATPVTVTAGNDTPNIDFTLTPGGSISGSVYSDNGTPLYGAHIAAYDNSTGVMVKVDEIWTPGASPNYRMGTDLPAGSYLVKADFVGYYSEYYDNVTDPDLATLVVVTVPNDTPNINFTLTAQGFSISDVSAIDVTDNTATIVWTTSELATSKVEYGLTDGYGSTTTENTTLTLSHSVSLTGLTRFTTYHYRVISKDVGNSEIVSGDYTFITLDLTPPVITNVTATNFTATGATITWTTDEPASSYVRYGTSANYDQHTDQFDTNPRVTSHTVVLTGLASGTTYHYRVRSWDSSTNQADSDDHTFTTLDITAPVISAVGATPTGTGAAITWTTGENATSVVDYGLTTGYGMTATDNSLVTTHTINLTGLTSETIYHFRVTSVDGSGNPASSGDYSFTTLDITAPVISSVTATNIAATSVTITWTTNELASSQVEYGLTTSYGSTTTENTTLTSSHSVNLTGLGSFKTYHYRVKSIDAGGNPATSADLTFTTTDVTAPVISVVTSSDITASEATITWTTNEAATTQVKYGLTEEYDSSTTEVTSLVTSHSVNLTGLKAGKTYHYQVISKDAANNQAVSADATFKTAASSGGMPTWAWVIIGLAAVGVLGAAAFLIRGRLAQG